MSLTNHEAGDAVGEGKEGEVAWGCPAPGIPAPAERPHPPSPTPWPPPAGQPPRHPGRPAFSARMPCWALPPPPGTRPSSTPASKSSPPFRTHSNATSHERQKGPHHPARHPLHRLCAPGLRTVSAAYYPLLSLKNREVPTLGTHSPHAFSSGLGRFAHSAAPRGAATVMSSPHGTGTRGWVTCSRPHN